MTIYQLNMVDADEHDRGLRIGRMLAILHPESVLGIHTVNPELPTPRYKPASSSYSKLRLARN